MKRKFLSALLVCTLILGSVLGLSACKTDKTDESPDETPTNPLIPQIPAGVKLNKVNEEDFEDTLSKFGCNYNLEYPSSNLIVKNYASYKETVPVYADNSIKHGSYEIEYFEDLKYLNTGDSVHGQNLTYDRTDSIEKYINRYIDNDITYSTFGNTYAKATSDISFGPVTINSITRNKHKDIRYSLWHCPNFVDIPVNIPDFYGSPHEFNYKLNYEEIPSNIIVSYLWSISPNTYGQIVIGMLNGFVEHGYGTCEMQTEMFADETRLYIICSTKCDVGCDTGDYPFKLAADDMCVTYIDLNAGLTENDFEMPMPADDRAAFEDLKEKVLSSQADFAQNKAVEIAPLTGEFSEWEKCSFLECIYSNYDSCYVYGYLKEYGPNSDEPLHDAFNEIFNKHYEIENGKIILSTGFYDELRSAYADYAEKINLSSPSEKCAIQINCKLNDYSVVLYLNA